ncbi:hypothetical protein GWI33_004327 [Rhynchophorus ferrugineus]|uniref:Uncharacterized protein n=1 Tax=Rhynchophorus ferrugineus TaxID=354439 RepID=A0A834IV68_RHYFE|nr:hypothetical protein GWI33_004327 [Rhynchophorus ferrugineus]
MGVFIIGKRYIDLEKYVKLQKKMEKYVRSGKINLQSRSRAMTPTISWTSKKQDFSTNVYRYDKSSSFKGDTYHGGKNRKHRLKVLPNFTETW